jgi:uncharacterized protein YndB with AHSA1/START domain
MKAANEYGSVPEPGTVHIERLLPGPAERIWAYLTEGDKRRQWLAGGDMKLSHGGALELVFNNSELTKNDDAAPAKYEAQACEVSLHGLIIECERPRLLSYSWGMGDDASEVRFELTPRGKDVLLAVTHRRIDSRDAMVSIGAGWHAHLGILADRLSGREPDGFWRTHTRLERDYEKIIPASAAWTGGAAVQASEAAAQP